MAASECDILGIPFPRNLSFSMFLGFHKLKDEVHIANTQITFVE